MLNLYINVEFITFSLIFTYVIVNILKLTTQIVIIIFAFNCFVNLFCISTLLIDLLIWVTILFSKT